MKRHSKLAALALGLATLGGAETTSAANGFYLGGAWGGTTFHHDAAVFDDGSLAGSGTVDGSDSGWKLFAGYRFNRRLAVEIGHTVLNNDYDLETTFSGGVSDGSGGLAAGGVAIDIHRPKATFFAAVGVLPLGPRAALSAKLGAQAWEARVTTTQSGGVASERRSDLDGLAGLGLTYRVAAHWVLQVDYERFMDIVDDDIDLFSVGFAYRFRGGTSGRRPQTASAGRR